MCGLAGELRFNDGPSQLAMLERMNHRHIPRGPHADGVFHQNRVSLGHRRLKVMDLSEHSQQPMYDPHLGLALVFNGAIYNYRELRHELQGMGYAFYSDGDTEVILKAYHAWGEACLQRFNGMFAIAIWNQASGDLWLARDRLGIKPLYYSQDAEHLVFASTLPALLEDPRVSRELDAEALHFYLHFHSVVPAPRTLLKQVKKLEPGHWLRVTADSRSCKQKWWDLAFGMQEEDRSRSEQDWQEALLAELRGAVARRNVAAVDVGILLSGGVDSSLLTALLHEVKPDIHTFSIGFDAVNGEQGDEFVYSDIIARHFNTRHSQIRIAPERMLTALPKAIAAMSEPMVSHDCVAFYLLSEEVSKSCRVVQSGQGADEIFAGYHWYPPLADSHDAVASYRAAFFDRSYEEYIHTVNPRWQTPDLAGEFVRSHFAAFGADDPVDKALRLDSQIMLVDDPVKRVDTMTMAHSLEARVPFLDHQLVEFAARIPARYKLAHDGKGILKQVARQLIPHEVIDRPKGYFPVPALKYLRGPVLDQVQEALMGRKARERGLFNTDYVEQLLARPDDHITPLRGSKLWQLGLLELWLQEQGI
ncbi:N-acetylglutaminylglutamine amidotransferase [Pokkaliibacter plantistimulans]|uniref:asparagine synthase (glutamine-hydrolyzing) n=1 Tax=Proteobacteria bacterium 228 TaxID=2083153 RepID=A0A2S5KTM0_9PROT|nr:N-acetylglutaminylglutamine amidotransferase [Pokkaliibacter plantistimulans]PPC78204.1 N-acetylglutaminylglutamine amidotransferase [Pokkaliibacter plantistimulans]